MKGRDAKDVRGMALLESAVWLVAILPVMLAAVSVAASVHDQNVFQVAPEAALREVNAQGMRWVPQGTAGRYDPNLEALRLAVAKVSEAGLQEVSSEAFKAKNVSAKACFWIYLVNSSTGRLESPIHEECDSRGPLGGELSLTPYVTKEVARGGGIPLGPEFGANRFVDRVVLVGVAVGGDLPAPLSLSATERVQFGAISIPRQEVTL